MGGGLGQGLDQAAVWRWGVAVACCRLIRQTSPLATLRQVTGRIEENWVRPQQSISVAWWSISGSNGTGQILEPQVYESSRNQGVDLLASGPSNAPSHFLPCRWN